MKGRIYGVAVALAVGAAMLLAVADVGAAHPQRVLTSHATYPEGSAGAQTVQQWLERHAVYRNGTVVGRLADIGSVEIVFTRTLRDRSEMLGLGGIGDGPAGPPVNLPTRGESGDTFSITTCGGGGSVEQTWVYEWQGDSDSGEWVLVFYSVNLKGCGSGH